MSPSSLTVMAARKSAAPVLTHFNYTTAVLLVISGHWVENRVVQGKIMIDAGSVMRVDF
jgi:hypothetical protein